MIDLEQRLADYGDVLEQALAERTADHTITDDPRRRRGSRRFVSAAAMVALLGGAAWLLQAHDSTVRTDVDSPAATVDSAPDDRTNPTPGVEACRRVANEFVAPEMLADEAVAPFLQPLVELTDGDPEVLVFPSPRNAQIWVSLVGSEARFHCRVANSITPIGRPSAQHPGLSPTPVGIDGVLIVDQSWSTAELQQGPGDYFAFGGRSDDVVSVEVEFANGTRISAALAPGWFLIDGRIPDGVPIGGEILHWTLRDGETQSAPASELERRRDD